MKLWANYEDLMFLELPNSWTEQIQLPWFKKLQTDAMSDVKTKLSANWNKEVVDILRKELETMDGDQTKKFFESVGTLMANQVCELITKSVNAYVDFFKQYEKKTYPLPVDIVKREYDVETEFEMSFLVLKLHNSNESITFEHSLHNVSRDLKNIVELIVATS